MGSTNWENQNKYKEIRKQPVWGRREKKGNILKGGNVAS